MKKDLLMKKRAWLNRFLLFGFLCLPMVVNAQTTRLLTDNFDYPTGDLYGQGGTGTNGWVKYGSNASIPIQVVTPSLTYPGYQDQAVGNAVRLTYDDNNTDQDLQRKFSDSGTGTTSPIYVSALVKVTDVSTITGSIGNEGAFLAFVQTVTTFTDGAAGTERLKVYVRAGSADNTFKIGISRGSEPSSTNTAYKYATADYELGKTYLLIVKYTIVSGLTYDDQVSLFLFENTIAPTEPTPVAIYSGETGTDVSVSGFQAIELRQGKAFGKSAPTVIIDALRVALTWADLFNPPAPKKYTWNGSAVANDWKNSQNWTPAGIPSAIDTVYIPGNAPNFPVLSGTQAGNTCKEIHFGFGAQIGRPDLLTYTKAFVELDFNDGKIETNRWHMLSMPIQEVVTGDLAFGGSPSVFLRKFDANATPNNGSSFIEGAWTDYYTSNTEAYAPGEGFIIWVNPFPTGKNNQFVLPYFADDAVRTNLNPFHAYDSDAKESTFELFNPTTKEGLGSYEVKERHDNTAYKMNTSNFTYPVTFTNGLALVGNPYMSSIDFSAFASSNNLKVNYKIFDGYTIGTISEITGSTLIAPLQSFLVESKGVEDGGVADGILTPLTFNPAISTVGNSVLRTSANISDRLEIIATNDAYSIHTFIATRENGSPDFGNSDSRKVLLGITQIPEIYTLKDYQSGKIGVDINVVNANNQLIPLALATSREGLMTLTFKGMDTYDAQITLIDRVANREIPLTGSTYEYEFYYTPKKSGARVVADEERFVIQLAPATPTDIDPVNNMQTWMLYAKSNAIHAVCASTDKIRQIQVYNTQGQLLYADDKINASSCTVQDSNLPTICIVKLITDKGVKNVKLINK